MWAKPHDQRRAVQRLELVELAAVHEAGDHFAHVVGRARFGRDDASRAPPARSAVGTGARSSTGGASRSVQARHDARGRCPARGRRSRRSGRPRRRCGCGRRRRPAPRRVTTSPVAAFTSGGPPRKIVPWLRTMIALVAHRRHVGAAGGAGAHHHRDLRDALRRHVGLVVEDAAEVVAVREDLVLERQVGAAGIDQVDAGQAVLLRRSPAPAGASSPSSGSRCRPSPWRRWRRSCTRCPATRPMPVTIAGRRAPRRRTSRARRAAPSSRNGEPGSSSGADPVARQQLAAREVPLARRLRRRRARTRSASFARRSVDQRRASAVGVGAGTRRERRSSAGFDQLASRPASRFSAVSLNSSRPISMRRISLVPAPIS